MALVAVRALPSLARRLYVIYCRINSRDYLRKQQQREGSLSGYLDRRIAAGRPPQGVNSRDYLRNPLQGYIFFTCGEAGRLLRPTGESGPPCVISGVYCRMNSRIYSRTSQQLRSLIIPCRSVRPANRRRSGTYKRLLKDQQQGLLKESTASRRRFWYVLLRAIGAVGLVDHDRVLVRKDPQDQQQGRDLLKESTAGIRK